MNKLNGIIDQQILENGKLYLLEKPCDGFGFFYQDGVVYFAKNSSDSSSGESVGTSCLDINLGVRITSDEENSSFKTGCYDMLAFKDDLKTSKFDVFYKICSSYAHDSNKLEFSEFFRTLVDLFNKPKDEIQRNLIGLIGELMFMKKIYEDFGANASNNWHLCGSNSKFDFSFQKFNVEVKTSTNENMTFLLKHSQIFNNQKNYVCVISIIETGEGDSVGSLVDYFSNNVPFRNNVKFQIAIQKELARVADKKDKERRFVLDTIEVFDCSKLKTIENIPGCISNVQYDYNFSETNSIDVSDLFETE